MTFLEALQENSNGLAEQLAMLNDRIDYLQKHEMPVENVVGMITVLCTEIGRLNDAIKRELDRIQHNQRYS